MNNQQVTSNVNTIADADHGQRTTVDAVAPQRTSQSRRVAMAFFVLLGNMVQVSFSFTTHFPIQLCLLTDLR